MSSHDSKQSTNCGKHSELPNWLTGLAHGEKKCLKTDLPGFRENKSSWKKDLVHQNKTNPSPLLEQLKIQILNPTLFSSKYYHYK